MYFMQLLTVNLLWYLKFEPRVNDETGVIYETGNLNSCISALNKVRTTFMCLSLPQIGCHI